jgi:hypothetical protein
MGCDEKMKNQGKKNILKKTRLIQSIIILFITSSMILTSLGSLRAENPNQRVKNPDFLINGDAQKIGPNIVSPPEYIMTKFNAGQVTLHLNDKGQAVGSKEGHACLWTQYAPNSWWTTNLGLSNYNCHACDGCEGYECYETCSYACDINNRGQIVGIIQHLFRFEGGFDRTYYIYFAIDPKDTTSPPDESLEWYYNASGIRAEDGGGNDLMQYFCPAWDYSGGGGGIPHECLRSPRINDNGQIVITKHDSTLYPYKADSYINNPDIVNGRYIWKTDSANMVEILVPGYDNVEVNDMNTLGDVTGEATVFEYPYSQSTAFFWSIGTGATILGYLTPTPPIRPQSHGNGINDEKQIVGDSYIKINDNCVWVCACLWTPDSSGHWTVQNLGVPTTCLPSTDPDKYIATPVSCADDINDKGYIIGSCSGNGPVHKDTGPFLIVPYDMDGNTIPDTWFYNVSGHGPTDGANDLGFAINAITPSHDLGISPLFEINETEAVTAQVTVSHDVPGIDCCILTPIPAPVAPDQPVDVTVWHTDACDKNKGISGRGINYTYKTKSTESNDKAVQYGWDWDGNGIVDEWTGFVTSGTSMYTVHSWANYGVYAIKVKARYANGLESAWSSPRQVRMFKLGDTYGDDAISYADINPFVLALNGKAGYYDKYPSGYYFTADCNIDYCVSYADINSFVRILNQPN